MDVNIVKLMALAVLVLPLFALPLIMKAAGGILERFGVWANNRQKGLIDRSRNWAQGNSKRVNANQRARLATAGEGWGKTGDREWGMNADGSKRAGLRARLARVAGGAARGTASTANFVGGYQARRDKTHAWQEENAKRIQDQEFSDILSEVDSQGRPTARAQYYATRAAGAGGQKNAERIRRLAMEQQKKELMADVGRETSAMASAGAMETGAYYWETDSKGNLKVDASGNYIGHDDHGRAMAAQARGEGYRVNKVGEARDATKGQTFVGDSAAKRYAAMMRSTNIGDGAAISYMMYGDEAKGIKAVDDKDLSDFMQFATDSSSKAGSKVPHLLTKDQGLTGMVGSKMVDIHGVEFKAAASRIRQLREQGNMQAAQAIQDAWESAYETLATDDQLSESFSQKHVDAMRDFNAIVSGVTSTSPTGKTSSGDRLVLREYGETLSGNGGNDRISDPSGATSTLRVANPLIGKASSKGFK